MDILEKIIANKQLEVARQKEAVPLDTLLTFGTQQMERPTVSMRKALEQSPCGIIAEFKRRSPSKGWLYPNAKVEDVVSAYERVGASACSILTDSDFFGGSLADLQRARSLVKLPLLRKDFIIDEYQLYQARVMGADAILLIAACLTPETCKNLARAAHRLDLEVLLEVHHEKELSHLNEYVDMLGVNNRNLGTFHTDVANSFRMIERMKSEAEMKSEARMKADAPSETGTKAGEPSETGTKAGKSAKTKSAAVAIGTERDAPLLISESGISEAKVISELRKVGFRGFLMGETFMKTENQGKALKDFIAACTMCAHKNKMLIKVCGMRDAENIRDVETLDVDYLGFIFYSKSPRYVSTTEEMEGIRRCKKLKVGVFVNETLEYILDKAKTFELNYLQLHGNETPDFCRALQRCGYPVIKAFPIASTEDFRHTEKYADCSDYFLFDTQCTEYGGSGMRFDWSLLNAYRGNVPFLLSGGLTPDCAPDIKQLRYPAFVGIDLNSGFETAPAQKNIGKLKTFIAEIRT